MTSRLCVLGSTGSIGTQALDVCRALDISVVGLAAGANAELLKKQAEEFKPLEYGIGGERALELATMEQCDAVLNAIGGAAGIRASFAALAAGKRLLLANKETVVACGDLLDYRNVIPIDSEHSAVFQCLGGSLDARAKGVSKIILTASGGAFRGFTKERLKGVTAAQALNHPTWKMGKKVTIDSATLMNKGFEVLEAAALFDMPLADIDVVIHPQSVIHSMVEFNDGAVLAQLAPPDMRLPIQYALTFPKRAESGYERLDFKKIKSLDFEEVDYDNAPCLKLALEAGKRGGGYPAVLVGADEAAVELFLNGKIGFLDIPAVIESALAAYNDDMDDSLEARLEAVQWGYRTVAGRVS